MSAKAAAKAAAKQAKKLRQKAKRIPIIAQHATHPLESAQPMSNVASEAHAAAPTAAPTAIPTTAATMAATAALTTAPASEQDASANAKQGSAAEPKCPQPSIQNAADATVTVSIWESDHTPVQCTDSMLTCCCQPARMPCVHYQPTWASTSCSSVTPQALTEQTCSLFLDGQRPDAVEVPAANKLFSCPITKVTFPVCLMRLLVTFVAALTVPSASLSSCCRWFQRLLFT